MRDSHFHFLRPAVLLRPAGVRRDYSLAWEVVRVLPGNHGSDW